MQYIQKNTLRMFCPKIERNIVNIYFFLYFVCFIVLYLKKNIYKHKKLKFQHMSKIVKVKILSWVFLPCVS